MAKILMERTYDLVSNGTDNHLMLVNLVNKGITGKAADAALDEAHITVNKNSVPNDPKSPFVTSGIRIGTPAVTTRGFKEEECEMLAHWIADVLDAVAQQKTDPESQILTSKIEQTKQQVKALCSRFPVYT